MSEFANELPVIVACLLLLGIALTFAVNGLRHLPLA